MSNLHDMQGATLGGFEIVERLGTGGMGSVYKAHDAALDRFVAIKILAAALETDPVCVKRFLREARSIAALRHPNLMHVYTVGEEQGLHYFAMEYIEGVPLSKYIADRGPLAVEDTMRITGQVLGALHKVHGAEVIHRDLKPGNVMIDTDGRAVVVDFGLSKDTTAMDLTAAGSIMGTPDYMAPEQIEGEAVGPHTDIYAVGVMTYEMLTKSKPFHRKSAVLTMRAHCEDTAPPLTHYRSDLPKSLEAVLRKAMCRDVPRRYSSAPAFAHDLARVCPLPVLSDLAQERAAPSAAPTILTDPTLASSGRHVPAAVSRKRRKRVKKKAARDQSAPSAATDAGGAQGRPHRTRRVLVIAGVVVLALLGLWGLIRLRRSRRRLRRDRYLNAPTGVEAPRIRVLTDDGRTLVGTLVESDREGLRLRPEGSKADVILRPGSWTIVRPVGGASENGSSSRTP